MPERAPVLLAPNCMWPNMGRKGFGNLTPFEVQRVKNIRDKHGVSGIFTSILLVFAMKVKKLKQEGKTEEAEGLKKEFVRSCRPGLAPEHLERLERSFDEITRLFSIRK